MLAAGLALLSTACLPDSSGKTGQETLTYVWRGNRFVQLARTYTDYTTTTSPTAPAPVDSAPAPAPTAARPVSPAPSYSTNGKSGN